MIDEYLMPFGKYKGQPISSIPDSYVAWLLKEGSLREPLKRELENSIWERARDRFIQEFIGWHYTYKARFYSSSSCNDSCAYEDNLLYDSMDGCLPNQ